MPAIQSQSVFICYSHKDQRWLKQLQTMLAPAQAQHRLVIWSDERIRPGDEWRTALDAAIREAGAAVLLVTANFLASEFITRMELPALLEAERSRGLTVLWVPVSDSIYQGTVIAKYEAVLDPAHPLDSLRGHKQKRAVRSIAHTIIEAVEKTPPQVPPVTVPEAPVAGSSAITISYRHESEVRGNDTDLRSALNAQFLALTLRTLSEALTTGIPALPKLKRAELGIYALPLVREWHPTLRSAAGDKVAREWTRSTATILKQLTLKAYCPALEQLDVRLISRVPTFTASLLTQDSGETILRYTPILEGEEPASTPTITIVSTSNRETAPIFAAYARIVNNMRSKFSPLTFPVMRHGVSRYEGERIDEFVNRLSSVCNHPKHTLEDARFEVRARVGETIARQIHWAPVDVNGERKVPPDTVYRAFDAARTAGAADAVTASIDFRAHTAAIEIGATGGEPVYEAGIMGRHIVGVFGLLTRRDGAKPAVLLRTKDKRPWAYDVPGGKVAVFDKSMHDALCREVFEELGALLDAKRLTAPISVKYDPLSRKEGVPVIAVYCHYDLGAAEVNDIEQSRLPEADAEEAGPIEFCSFDFVISTKTHHRHTRLPDSDEPEALCHAPLEAFVKLAALN